MNDKRIDELIDQALRDEKELPEGLSQRLEQYVDSLIEDDKAGKTVRLKRRSLYWLSGVAAAVLLGVVLFFQTENMQIPQPTTADTFTNPQEAALAAQEALAFLSTQLNKGIDQVSDAKEEVDKVNQIVNKQFNDLNIQ